MHHGRPFGRDVGKERFAIDEDKIVSRIDAKPAPEDLGESVRNLNLEPGVRRDGLRKAQQFTALQIQQHLEFFARLLVGDGQLFEDQRGAFGQAQCPWPFDRGANGPEFLEYCAWPRMPCTLAVPACCSSAPRHALFGRRTTSRKRMGNLRAKHRVAFMASFWREGSINYNLPMAIVRVR